MSTLLAMVLAQVVVPSTAQSLAWADQVQWRDGAAMRSARLETTVVAAPVGDEALATRLRGQGATVLRSNGRLTLWQVSRADVVLMKEPSALPVYRDEKRAKRRVPTDAVLVIPKQTDSIDALRVRIGRGAEVVDGLVRVPCEPRDAVALAKSLSSVEGVDWAQPNWWLDARGK